MNGADYIILGVLLVSMLLGMYRGFVRESIGLLAWLGGLWLAWRYAPLVEPLLGGAVGEPPVRTWTARALIVAATVLLGYMPALDNTCKCQCTWGGTISVVNPGQATELIP